MAGIKYILQKEVFDSDDERILSVCNVSELYKKKKNSYLVILANPKSSIQVQIVQIKQYEKQYKKKRSWQLDEVKLVDGKGDGSPEFDLWLERQYKWFAPNSHERQNFITVLWKQMQKHRAVGGDVFKNIPLTWLEDAKSPDRSQNKEIMSESQNMDLEPEDGFEEFQALTEKEEMHLNKLMGDCDFAISNAEQFMEQLGKNLVELDGANVQSVLASETQVNALMAQIETAIQEAELIEQRLDGYDEILCHIRDTMEKMGEKNSMIEIANSNNFKLLKELETVVQQLDLPYNYQKALTEPDLTSQVGLDAAVAAAKALQNCLNSDIDRNLLRLTAVQDQRKRFEKWKMKFSQTVSRHLNNLFIHLGNDLGNSNNNDDHILLPKHTSVHKELTTFSELMHWLKAMDRKSYDQLTKIYTNSLNKIYDREIKCFFDNARSQIRLDELNMSTESASKSKQVQVPYGVIGVNRDLWSPGIDPNERQKLDSILEKVLGDLEPVALSEQLFCISFFQMDVISPGSKNTQTTLDGLGGGEGNSSTNSDSFVPVQQKKLDRQINEEVRKMMTELFGCLETELTNFIQGFEKLDSFYSMYVLVRLSQHVMSAQDAHSFLSMTFASSLVQVKRNFDKFMTIQCQSIKDAKIPKRSKCGLLPYVENFEEFARTCEKIFKKSERRADLEKSYIRIVEMIFETIPVHALEHAKTPRQVVNMENFHHMHSQLAQLKVPALEVLKKDAKNRYNEALNAYVTKYFGRPLEKLNLFFEGVQQKVSQGVKEQEISYQMAFSKQELRKVISQYPAREVKKGLESLYKKVEKHLCDEENLLQVVWRAMQEEFIQQYNFLEERIQRCYAGAMISLDFSIGDILEFFSEIARSH